MQQTVTKQGQVWSVILAGGEGERIKPLVQRWMGRHVPKQYCRFVGRRSMLEHTLDRADRISSPACKVSVIGRSHRWDAGLQFQDRQPGTVLMQPANQDTAAGVFLPLTYVYAHDQEATVVILPSDHFIYPEDRFLESVHDMVKVAERLQDHLVLQGVVPDKPECEYGWIEPGPEIAGMEGDGVRKVRAFLEKPAHEQAEQAMQRGALWNTLVMAGKVKTFWQLGWTFLPDMMPLFERLGREIGTAYQGHVLDEIYEVMPKRNFSVDLLSHATDHIVVAPLSGVIWSDWGKPERIVETLQRIGKTPSFPPEALDEPDAGQKAASRLATKAG